eukprot:365252-Chlamydomonas_euryale.AAC.20
MDGFRLTRAWEGLPGALGRCVAWAAVSVPARCTTALTSPTAASEPSEALSRPLSTRRDALVSMVAAVCAGLDLGLLQVEVWVWMAGRAVISRRICTDAGGEAPKHRGGSRQLSGCRTTATQCLAMHSTLWRAAC